MRENRTLRLTWRGLETWSWWNCEPILQSKERTWKPSTYSRRACPRPYRRGGHAIPTGSTVPTLRNVKLVGGQEVFGQFADGITSQPPWVGHGGDDSRDSIWITQHTDDMGNPIEALLPQHSLDTAFPVHRSHGVRLSAIAFVSAYAMALEAAAYALVRRRVHASAAPARGILLAQRDRDVDHLHLEVINERRLPGRRVDMVETIGVVHNQRGEPPIQHGHVIDEAARDVEAGLRRGVHPKLPRGHEDAVPGRGLDRHLVQRRVEDKKRCGRGGTYSAGHMT